jgi:hypothetical protein
MRFSTRSVLKIIEDVSNPNEALDALQAAKQLIESQYRELEHLNKMVVWAEDITMHGVQTDQYEAGFWDAVDYVKNKQHKGLLK